LYWGHVASALYWGHIASALYLYVSLCFINP
jgi:hypothetical protein